MSAATIQLNRIVQRRTRLKGGKRWGGRFERNLQETEDEAFYFRDLEWGYV